MDIDVVLSFMADKIAVHLIGHCKLQQNFTFRTLNDLEVDWV